MTKEDEVKAKEAAKQLMSSFSQLRSLAASDPDKDRSMDTLSRISKIETLSKKVFEPGGEEALTKYLNKLSN